MTLTIRTLTEHDFDVANEIAMAAYRASSSRREELALYVSLQPDGWLIADYDGRAAGIGGVVNFGPYATLGMMGVHPSQQRRGVARALVERLTDWLDQHGVPLTALDASDMGAPLYPQYGFEDRGHTLQFRRTSPGTPSSDARSAQRASERGAIVPVTRELLPAVVAVDTPIFGADRTPVLVNYLTRYAGRMFASAANPPLLDGFIVARSTQIGPWVAQSPESAAALLRRALELPFEQEAIINVPAENKDALALLEQVGFHQTRALRHMVRGSGTPPGRRDLVYGQASFAIG